MSTRRRRIGLLLALSAACLPHTLRAAAAGPVALADVFGAAKSAPAFRASVLAELSRVEALIAESPRLGPSVPSRQPAAPAPADRWHQAAVQVVGALARAPRIVESRRNELRDAFGDEGLGRLIAVSRAVQQRPELLARIETLGRGLDLDDDGDAQEFASRMKTLFESSAPRPEGAGGAVAAPDSARQRRKLPPSWSVLSPADAKRGRLRTMMEKANVSIVLSGGAAISPDLRRTLDQAEAHGIAVRSNPPGDTAVLIEDADLDRQLNAIRRQFGLLEFNGHSFPALPPSEAKLKETLDKAISASQVSIDLAGTADSAGLRKALRQAEARGVAVRRDARALAPGMTALIDGRLALIGSGADAEFVDDPDRIRAYQASSRGKNAQELAYFLGLGAVLAFLAGKPDGDRD